MGAQGVCGKSLCLPLCCGPKTVLKAIFKKVKNQLGIILEVIHTCPLIFEAVMTLNYFFHFENVPSFQDNEEKK